MREGEERRIEKCGERERVREVEEGRTVKC